MTKILTMYKECKKHYHCEESCKHYVECMQARKELKRKITEAIRWEALGDGEETDITQ
jgi:hypothetical protein